MGSAENTFTPFNMPEKQKTAILWFRQDLRLADNPALLAARENAECVIPVFIWNPENESDWSRGAASKWYLHQSLASLADALDGFGNKLIFRKGDPAQELKEIVAESGAELLYWNRCYEPAAIERDKEIKEELRPEIAEVKSFNGSMLFEPWEIATGSGTPYKVYTPFSNKYFDRMDEIPEPLGSIRKLQRPHAYPDSLSLDDLQLMPEINWYKQIEEHWHPGEQGAQKRLQSFLEKGLDDYDEERDRPDHSGTSRLSPSLHNGEISPRQIWTAVNERYPRQLSSGAKVYLKEIIWREFAYSLLFHFPHTTDEPLREDFANFPWRNNESRQAQWQKGETGYPIVDAGMRQLWGIGWMHNRVRMIVASFLIKDLNIPWRSGAKWFWDTLVDADLANNTLGWQWTAGCGADAAPFFRIFNPVSQGERFDPRGDYVRKWVPELKDLPNKYLHKPWEAPEDVLKEAGIILGEDYSEPMVDHSEVREEALENYDRIKN